jgi:hypothetical protein
MKQIKTQLMGLGIVLVGIFLVWAPVSLFGAQLHDARIGEIIVESPDRFFRAINQSTAKQIGVNIPRGILERADQLIQ